MRILFISTTYPTPTRPRQGAFNQVLVHSLRHRNEVQVVAPIPWTQWHEPRSPDVLEELVHHPIYFYPPKFLRAHYAAMYWQSIRRTIQQVGQDFKPDVVLGYFLHPDGYAANIAARHFGVASVVMSGGTDLRLLTKSASRKARIQQTLSQANRLIVVSRELAERAKSLGIQEAKIDVVYRGIDRNCFQPMRRDCARRHCQIPDEAVVILWVGRLEPVKNPALLLAAALRWQQRWNRRLQIKMIGDGALRRELIQRSWKLGLQDVFELLPPMNQQQLARYYNAANATVLTSRSEGIPNVLLESIACNTPLVATNVGGVAEIASPEIDYLVPSEDADSLAEAVIACVEQPSAQSRVFVPYDQLSMAAAVEQALQRAIDSQYRAFEAQTADTA